MGKVDRTADEIFDDHVQNFNKQQNAANKLQKELNNYIRCVKGKKRTLDSLHEPVLLAYIYTFKPVCSMNRHFGWPADRSVGLVKPKLTHYS